MSTHDRTFVFDTCPSLPYLASNGNEQVSSIDGSGSTQGSSSAPSIEALPSAKDSNSMKVNVTATQTLEMLLSHEDRVQLPQDTDAIVTDLEVSDLSRSMMSTLYLLCNVYCSGSPGVDVSV